jgi:UDP-N-acetylglucosamine:LPS N-acetylglucosamine transferase
MMLAGHTRRRLLLVCSSGGHLTQLHALEPWWSKHDRMWVTFDKEDARALLEGERVIGAHHPTTRNVPNAVRNFMLARHVFDDYRPDLVVSTGAGVAVPFFLAARRFGARTMYVEVYDRIDSPTLTGRMCYPLSDLFLLQWPEQQRFYPRGKVIGSLL